MIGDNFVARLSRRATVITLLMIAVVQFVLIMYLLGVYVD